MPKNACILLNGYYDLTRSAWYQQQIQQPDTLLVAVDGGLHACTPLGLRPVLIIGDFDSISESELTQFMGSEIVRLSKNKDFTDGEVAVRECINRSVSDITLFGALAVAGETDQELGNIFMMHMAKKMAAQKGITPFQIKLMDPRQVICLLEDERLEVKGVRGDTVSILPLTDNVTVCYEGCKYPLDGTKKLLVAFGETRTLRNECVAEKYVVEITGRALCIRNST